MKYDVRPEVLDFKAYSPGLNIEEIKEKYGLEKVVKLASNENPLGTSRRAADTLRQWASSSFRYPQAGNPDLARAISKHLNVSRECIVTGNGSDEIIDLLIRVKTQPGKDNIVVCDPSFSIYSLQARLSGVELRKVALHDDFSLPLSGMLEKVDQQTGLVFVTSPDNPSGVATPGSVLQDFASDLPKGCLLVVDEAYIEFTDPIDAFDTLQWWSPQSNVVVLRTFSKMYGLAGLRLGYGIMPPWLADCLLRVKLPFSVNILAEKAGMAALQDTAFVNATLETVRSGKAYLSDQLERLGCQVTPSQSNFILFRPPVPAQELFESLLARGVIIRPLASYDMPERLRVSIGTEDENMFFISCLEQELGHV